MNNLITSVFKCVFIVLILSPIVLHLLESHRPDGVHSGNPLDGCLHVYLDLGTNTGVQIRKLFEPHKFPEAPALAIFEKYFGPAATRNLSSICAVGFEPNPDHEPNLQFLASLYTTCGWRTTIHTRTAVDTKNRVASYARIDYVTGLFWDLGVAGRLVDRGVPQNDTTQVTAVRIAEYVNDVVAAREIPENEGEGAVVMKLDVEGKELEIMADLVMSGALKHIDNIHVDWTSDPYSDYAAIESMRKAIGFITQVAKNKSLVHVTDIEDTDDESFGTFSGDFPQCF